MPHTAHATTGNNPRVSTNKRVASANKSSHSKMQKMEEGMRANGINVEGPTVKSDQPKQNK